MTCCLAAANSFSTASTFPLCLLANHSLALSMKSSQLPSFSVLNYLHEMIQAIAKHLPLKLVRLLMTMNEVDKASMPRSLEVQLPKSMASQPTPIWTRIGGDGLQISSFLYPYDAVGFFHESNFRQQRMDLAWRSAKTSNNAANHLASRLSCPF